MVNYVTKDKKKKHLKATKESSETKKTKLKSLPTILHTLFSGQCAKTCSAISSCSLLGKCQHISQNDKHCASQQTFSVTLQSIPHLSKSPFFNTNSAHAWRMWCMAREVLVLSGDRQTWIMCILHTRGPPGERPPCVCVCVWEHNHPAEKIDPAADEMIRLPPSQTESRTIPRQICNSPTNGPRCCEIPP